MKNIFTLSLVRLKALIFGQGHYNPEAKTIGCPFHAMLPVPDGHSHPNKVQPKTNHDWWPNQLNIDVLRSNTPQSNPMGAAFDYSKAFEQLDISALKSDLVEVMHSSVAWWPSDFGHYGPLFIRMAWHSAGTYRTGDGRGGSRAGQQRFAPLNSWPDNANLDKARRLLWPIKQKYGSSISWADLMVLAGNVALEDMGFKTIGFSGGRADVWEPEKNIYWGAEQKWLEDQRHNNDRHLQQPLAAVQMGLIYVNPEGPNGHPNPAMSAHDIRATFGRMGMNDEETVALIAGGHSFGKAHGAGSPSHVGAEPEAAPIASQGFGWSSTYKTGKGQDNITSGLEVTWTATPVYWSHFFFKSLFENDWQLVKSPGGAHQWEAKNPTVFVPNAFDETKKHKPTMLTTDLALRFDPAYEKIARRFYENPNDFEKAFALAWYKLTHRDMGPKALHLGSDVLQEDFIWQDPLPDRNFELINDADMAALKSAIRNSGVLANELIKTAWASASTFRSTDLRGGANGARVQLEPQKNWEVNNPEQLSRVLGVLTRIQNEFNISQLERKVSLADLIILGGSVGVEMSLPKAYAHVQVPFRPGRVDAKMEQTDTESFAVLEPMADGFRNYQKTNYTAPSEILLLDKAQMLGLTAPELTVLIGGMRVLNTNYDGSSVGMLTTNKNQLTNDFFIHLLDMQTEWRPIDSNHILFEGRDRLTNELKWTASRVDLIFGSHSELRAIAEVFASQDAQQKFVLDFISAWTKVMELDRFDLR